MLGKPKDVNKFLNPFVNDLNNVLQEGLNVKEKHITIKLRCFICDTPARSMLRGIYEKHNFLVTLELFLKRSYKLLDSIFLLGCNKMFKGPF